MRQNWFLYKFYSASSVFRYPLLLGQEGELLSPREPHRSRPLNVEGPGVQVHKDGGGELRDQLDFKKGGIWFLKLLGTNEKNQ